MSLLTISTFLALLALLAAAGIIVVLLLVVAGTGSAAARDNLERLRGLLAPAGLWMAWLVAATAMAGSLYFSEGAGLVPCALCWYQRIAMYPMAIVLLIAAWRGDIGIRPYAATIAGIGAVISGYHILVQRLPGLPSGSCSLESPCSAIYIERFGFVTIPVMAFIGFAAILTIMLFITPTREEATTP
jgi:disulfide bond formation protein DsbB